MYYSIQHIATLINAKLHGSGSGNISYLLIDSRAVSVPEASLFFAIVSKTNDGHRYIRHLYNLGVRHFVVSTLPADAEQMGAANFLVVKDSVKSLQQLARLHRERFSYPVIGITGSNGKTMVKEFLYQLLRKEFVIVRSPRSFNSQLGVPLSVWQMDDQHTLAIIEAGISQADEMEHLEKIVQPTVGILTNIGEAHQENFLSARQKCIEKLSLFNHSEAIIYDADVPLFVDCLETTCLLHKAIGWSRKDTDAPLYVESIRKEQHSTRLACTLLGYHREFVLPFVDDASIENILHCLALMLYLKPSSLKEACLRELEPVEMRLEVKEGRRNCLLIDDAYNADINSLSIALDFLQSRETSAYRKKVLIFSDILQSGIVPSTLYKRVADMILRHDVRQIVGIGSELMAHEQLFSMDKAFFKNTEDFLKSELIDSFQDDLILIKGSRKFRFEQIAERLEKKVHETLLEVNLNALVDNFNYFRSKLSPNTKMVCMVKAAAYGAGANEIAKTLQEHRCDYLAVAVADEGVELRNEGISIPIIVMNPERCSLDTIFRRRLEPEVYSFQLLDAVIRKAERYGTTNYPIHLKIDTGMHRLGFRMEDIPAICARIKKQCGVSPRSVFSHLVGSDSPAFDDFTEQQVALFTQIADELEKELGCSITKHILNSAGIERFPKHQKDMVRLGIGLHGISAIKGKHLKAVSTLRTVILQTQKIPAGSTIGYSRKGCVSRDSLIATIPIGYADGLNRRLGNGVGEVYIRGKRCPIVGNICMDACMVDVTDIEAKEGDVVEIFGENISIEEIAKRTDTIPYEVLTAVSARVKRVYYR